VIESLASIELSELTTNIEVPRLMVGTPSAIDFPTVASVAAIKVKKTVAKPNFTLFKAFVL
jgi:hypothetical protein